MFHFFIKFLYSSNFACSFLLVGTLNDEFCLRIEINASVHNASLYTNFIVVKFCRVAVVSVEQIQEIRI